MNNLTIPPSPNWYESKILACSSDNTIIYGSRNDIVIIKPKPVTEPADIEIIPYAHYERVTSIDCIPNWGPDNMLAVTAGEDKVVKLWNLQNLTCKHVNNAHTAKADRLVGAVFAGTGKIITVSESGFITLWHISSHEIIPLRNVFLTKVQITTLSACPHSPWLVAFGLKCGLVIVTDLRKTGKVLYKMRGHDKAVISLSWCPTPFNIFPKVMAKSKITLKKNHENAVKNGKNIDENAKENNVIQSETTDMKDSKEIITDEKQSDKMPNENDSLEVIKKNEGEVTCNISLESSNIEDISRSSEEIPISDEKTTSIELDSSIEKQDSEIVAGSDRSNESEVSQIENDTPLTSSPKIKNITPEVCEKVENLEDANMTLSSPEIKDTATEVGEKVENLEAASNEDVKVTESQTQVNDTKSTEPSREYLLASSAKGGPIFIWRAATDGRKQIELHLSQNRNKRNYRGNDKIWLTLCWNTPETLLCSSPTGELLQWDLLRLSKENKLPQKKIIHHDHGSNLFAIAAPLRLYLNFNTDEENWRDKKDIFAWTIGQERFLLCTSLQSSRTTLVSYPTNGGFVYCVTSSPLDPNRLAVGIGDNTAKIWDLSRPHVQCVVMTNLWQRIQSKVLSLAWHPSKESILAYGTFEGRIGLINSNNPLKAPSLLVQYFRSAVNKITWGPLNGNVNAIGLYASGEGKLAIYDTECPLDEPEILKLKEHITTMSWKSDYTVLAVGTKSGVIFVYDLNLTLTTTIYTQQKTILGIAWHPEATAEDSGSSVYNSWFAVSTGDASVIIYDISREKAIGDGNEDTDNRVVAVLHGHSKPVRGLCWSPFEGAKLVSGGDDGLAQVWDVKTKSIVSTFTGHGLEAILTVLWSPLNKNYIITGGKDNCVRIWNITENNPMSEGDLKEVRKERVKLKLESRKYKETEETNDVEEIKIKRNLMLNLTTKAQNSVNIALEDCKRMFSLKTNGIHTETNGTGENNTSDANKIDVIKIFGDKSNVIKLLELEQNFHTKKQRPFCDQHISLWKGDIAETIKEAIKNGTVNPWLISMAPMVSSKLWQDACDAYVTRIIDDSKSDPIETVSYLLACHKIESAIEVLCNAKLYREALVLAKCRLLHSDPVIKDILYNWAKFAIVGGTYEIATQCFIALEEYEEAAKALFKRSDPETLEFAVKLAEKSGNKDLTDALTVRYNIFKNNKTEKADTNSKDVLNKMEKLNDTKSDEKADDKLHDTKIEEETTEEMLNEKQTFDDIKQEEETKDVLNKTEKLDDIETVENTGENMMANLGD